MAIAIALLGFNDLGCSVDPYFSFQKQILFTIVSTLSENEQKINVGSLKKFQDFLSSGHAILPSCGCKAHETMWLNTKLFFKEPQQLTKFT